MASWPAAAGHDLDAVQRLSLEKYQNVEETEIWVCAQLRDFRSENRSAMAKSVFSCVQTRFFQEVATAHIRNAHRWCAVISKPGSAWLEGTPAMGLGSMNVVLKWMYLYVGIGCRDCDYL